MVKHLTTLFFCFVILSFSFTKQAYSQCNNAGVENGNFTGWTGTWEDSPTICNGGTLFGLCLGTSGPDPFHYPGLNQGPNNQPANMLNPQGNEDNHFIMTGGIDPYAGAGIPVVFPGGGTYSMRLGNGQAEDGGESVSYSFVVTPTNCNFTYHYAVVINDGGHPASESPYFQIRMTDGNSNSIDCATYDVDASTAPSIGGFITLPGDIFYKPWSSVFIPLNNYMGQNVTIQFITRDCFASGGSHFAYAYIDATCGPLEIISSSPTVCGGQNVNLTAPLGAATYQWTGPGVTPPGNTQIATITLAGAYTVTMTTFGNVPCTFSLDTIIPGSPGNPVSNFSATSACAGDEVQFTDQSTPNGSITQWWWDFNGDNVPDETIQNPTYAFPTPGTYPVRLLISWPPCLDDTIINVTVISNPTSTFTVTSPVCAGISVSYTHLTLPTNREV